MLQILVLLVGTFVVYMAVFMGYFFAMVNLFKWRLASGNQEAVDNVSWVLQVEAMDAVVEGTIGTVMLIY